MDESKDLARSYYEAVGAKDGDTVASMLDEHVSFVGPFASLHGKEAVLTATTHFMDAFRSLTIQDVLTNGERAVVIYSVDMPDVSDDFPGASWLTFNNGRIQRIQLFYDGVKVAKKKDEIFGE